MKNNKNLNIIIVFLGFSIITASIIFLSNSLSIIGSVTGFAIIFFSKDIAKYFKS
ncbi:hypothetical protein GCM10025879_20830 [Leuconostoc litchii]|nr:hypothetical protein GCM10025879_20750 [Leuconostoc litchii]GMA70837.1 hypothetical protein GCM10025879_20830 [Leuconostoc litchii]